MKTKIFFIVVSIFFIFQNVLADDLTLTVNQTEYFFKTGENAIISLESNNEYEKKIDGLLSYTITQSINQANFQYSSTNTKSSSFTFDKGITQTLLNFGTSDTPMILDVNFKFSFKKDESRVVNLNNIKIHFVEDGAQKNNQENQKSSSSQKESQSSNPQNQKQPSNTEQKLQNNQLTQDSSALKKEIQKQQKTQEEFKKELSKNQDFQKENQDLLDKGYNPSRENLNPINNTSGDFEISYEKNNGEKATLKGNMKNKELKNLLSVHGSDYKKNFQYSVLEVSNLNTSDIYIFERETYWKEVLLSRKYGLNSN